MLTRETLENNNIIFDEEHIWSVEGPSHVDKLRVDLLDFDGTVSDRLGLRHEGEENEYKTRSEDIGASDFERGQITKSVKEARYRKAEARRLDVGRDREAEWQQYYWNEFFRPLAEAAKVADEHSRM